MKPGGFEIASTSNHFLQPQPAGRFLKKGVLGAGWSLLLVIAFASAALGGEVAISSPVDGSMVNSAVHIHAAYSGGTGTATYMKLWIDHNPSTVQHNTNVFDASVSLTNRPHLIEVQALDPSGQLFVSAANIQVAALAVNPPASSRPPASQQQFTASDSSSSSITWSATGGSITSGGLYTAGATTGTFLVKAADASGNKTTAEMIIAPLDSVTIENPTANATVPSPVEVHATYNQTTTATYMKVWVDHTPGLVEMNTNSFTASLYLPGGPHLIEVQASDPSTGQVYTNSVHITVPGASAGLNYTTWKNDNWRTGQQLQETILTPGNVNSAHFGVLFSQPVDGYVFAQPLYLSHLSIAGGTHNVVFVATEHDSVYAFDADKSASPLWHTSLIPSGASTVPQSLAGGTIYPENGITGTPVINPSTGTLYVVSETLESGKVVFRLHALKVATGEEEGGSPVVISPSGFQPKEQLQRPGLLLANGNVYAAFGSQGDHQPYHGWILSFAATSLAPAGVWSATPAGTEGAIWMSGSGLAADSGGNVYAITSNGSWDGASNLSDSFVKLSPNLTLLDYFTPFNQALLSADDQDLGSGGMLLVPDQAGAFPHEAIGCGKNPAIYVLDRDNMGKFQSGSNSQIIQEVDNQVGGTSGHQAPDRCFMTPVFWQQTLYFAGSNDVLKAFSFNASTGRMSSTPISKGSFEFVFPGGQPVVSANGAGNGIVWVVDHSSSVALHAYNATNLTTELYRSPGLGAGAKFAAPTIVNGKVYVGTASKLFVFASH